LIFPLLIEDNMLPCWCRILLAVLDPDVSHGRKGDEEDGSSAGTAYQLYARGAGLGTYPVMRSPKNQTLSSVCTTPRAADDTICVTGDVTLMERKPAMQMRKPTTP
jgi:hypothetical protein